MNPDRRARVDSLDYLRGLMALAVMVYHYTTWGWGPQEADSVLGRLGVYAVSTFYILSGVSLGMVTRLRDAGDVRAFAVRRTARIVPLFWLATSLALLTESAGPVKLLLNYTLAFGFLDPAAYIATGAWSIGNEVVFYVLLPFALLLRREREAFVVAAALGLVYAFAILDADRAMAAQWRDYVHPANQAFLFFGGVLIARSAPRAGAGWVLAAAVAVFVLWPAHGSQAELIAGWPRVVLSAACFAAVWGLFHWNPTVLWAAPLAFLGQGCYSIYLLHPIVAQPFKPLGPWGYVLAGATTLLVSAASFRWLERPMIEAGARLARRWRDAG